MMMMMIFSLGSRPVIFEGSGLVHTFTPIELRQEPYDILSNSLLILLIHLLTNTFLITKILSNIIFHSEIFSSANFSHMQLLSQKLELNSSHTNSPSQQCFCVLNGSGSTISDHYSSLNIIRKLLKMYVW